MTEFHEAANIFPLEEETIPDLAEDIRKNGQQVPIERFEGKVIDGRRRLKACERAGVRPTFRDITTTDAVAYVLSLNLHRRHLTPSQRSMVGAKAREIYDEPAKHVGHQPQQRWADPAALRQGREGIATAAPAAAEEGPVSGATTSESGGHEGRLRPRSVGLCVTGRRAPRPALDTPRPDVGTREGRGRDSRGACPRSGSEWKSGAGRGG